MKQVVLGIGMLLSGVLGFSFLGFVSMFFPVDAIILLLALIYIVMASYGLVIATRAALHGEEQEKKEQPEKAKEE